jgi:intracellular septation protein A
MEAAAASHGITLKWVSEIAAAIFGVLGTWLMSRRYADSFLQNTLLALTWPLLILFGQGNRIRRVIKARFDANRDIPESIVDMVLGLNLLFWAFFLQVAALILEAKGK